MTRIIVLEGYTNPFGGYSRRGNQQHHLGGSTMRKQQSKMKKCAVAFRRSRKAGSYRAFMRKCLKKGHRA